MLISLALSFATFAAHGADVTPAEAVAQELRAAADRCLQEAAGADQVECLERVREDVDEATVKKGRKKVPVNLPNVASDIDLLLAQARELKRMQAWVGRVDAAYEPIGERAAGGPRDEALVRELEAFLQQHGTPPEDLRDSQLELWPTSLEVAPLLLEELTLEVRTRVVAEPPWQAQVAEKLTVTGPVPVLRQGSSTKNGVTDVDAWFSRNGLGQRMATWQGGAWTRVADAPPVPTLPGTLGPVSLRSVLRDDDGWLALYQNASGQALHLGRFATDGTLERIYDLTAFGRAPSVKAGDEAYVAQEITWARTVDAGGRPILVVSTGHRTYAASSGGQNAYVTALDADTGALLWRSQPLVANAANFEVLGSSIVSGYGFTAEPDALYVLDLATGAVRTRLPLKSGPEWILRKDDTLYVRCYDTDVTFAIKGL